MGVVLGILGGLSKAHGQALPTAEQGSSLSVFGGGSGVFTGIKGGRNLGITAGADYTLWHFAGFRPAVEVRGTYPFYEGHVESQKSILAGVRVERRIGRLLPYGDFLIGRGEINYVNPAIVPGPFGVSTRYIRTDSTVYSPGVGLEYDLTRHFAGRADGQFQRWETPVTSSGTVWAKQFTVGITYRLDFNHHWRASRQR
jgi:hypothetical protein